MKYKTIMRKLRENGWNMKFDARENALIEDIAKITENNSSQLEPLVSGQQLAEQFHKLYEEIAPQFGYETREETKIFNPESNNGKLMIAVSEQILKWLSR